eukprot:Opistho-2@57278
MGDRAGGPPRVIRLSVSQPRPVDSGGDAAGARAKDAAKEKDAPLLLVVKPPGASAGKQGAGDATANQASKPAPKALRLSISHSSLAGQLPSPLLAQPQQRPQAKSVQVTQARRDEEHRPQFDKVHEEMLARQDAADAGKEDLASVYVGANADELMRAYSRRMFVHVGAQVLAHSGYNAAEADTLELMSEVMQVFMGELGRRSRGYAELGGRTISTTYDTRRVLADLGFDARLLLKYLNALRQRPAVEFVVPVFPALPRHIKIDAGTANPSALLNLEKAVRPPIVPSHLPPFPEKHTFVDTPVYTAIDIDRAQVLGLACKQRRQMEDGMWQFAARTAECRVITVDDISYRVLTDPTLMPSYCASLKSVGEMPPPLRAGGASGATTSGGAPHPHPHKRHEEKAVEEKRQLRAAELARNNPYMQPPKNVKTYVAV